MFGTARPRGAPAGGGDVSAEASRGSGTASKASIPTKIVSGESTRPIQATRLANRRKIIDDSSDDNENLSAEASRGPGAASEASIPTKIVSSESTQPVQATKRKCATSPGQQSASQSISAETPQATSLLNNPTGSSARSDDKAGEMKITKAEQESLERVAGDVDAAQDDEQEVSHDDATSAIYDRKANADTS